MTYCAQCGSVLNDIAAPCGSCGATVRGAGLPPTTAALLSYLFGLVSGIIFLAIDQYRNDSFVRFHAFQSVFFNIAWIGFWIAWTIASVLLGTVTGGLFALLSIPIDVLLGLGGFGCWLWLMYKAWQGQRYELPYIGKLAARQTDIKLHATPEGNI